MNFGVQGPSKGSSQQAFPFWMLFARGKRFLYNRSTSKKHLATAESDYILQNRNKKNPTILLLVT
jgi:hypothetical protein